MNDHGLNERKWYQKKRFLIPIGIIVSAAFLNGGDSEVKYQDNTYIPVQVENKALQAPIKALDNSSVTTPTKPPAPSTNTNTQTQGGLSNNNYYTNIDGNSVHSPAYSDYVPPDASARCRDGTYSFSQNRQGTCSRHGGVESWLN